MTTESGPQRRRLLEGRAGELYRDVVGMGVLPADDPRLHDGLADQEALALLIDLGLVREDLGDGDRPGWVAVDPAAVQSGVVAPMGREAVELLAESAAWADTFSALAQAFRRTPATGSQTSEIRGLPSINRFLESAVDDAESELLTAQPAGARRAVILQQAVDRDLRTIERGVHMRTLYQHTARRSKATRDYVNLMLTHGAQVRTLDEFFNRLIVVDREVAIIPSGDDLNTALAIRDSGLVAYLVDIFERFWDRGRPFTNRETSTLNSIAHEQRAMAIRMLIEGHADATCAKRLGVSPRTYAGYVADLKDEFDAQTRFQLGYRMGQDEAKPRRSRK